MLAEIFRLSVNLINTKVNNWSVYVTAFWDIVELVLEYFWALKCISLVIGPLMTNTTCALSCLIKNIN